MTPGLYDAGLAARLDRIKRLIDELARVQHDAQAMRDLIDRLGRELAAARNALKPLDTP